jgi:hypothetical protein
MQLNNEIANLKKKSELIDDERNKLKNQEQENSTQQFEKITQLSRILMAISKASASTRNLSSTGRRLSLASTMTLSTCRTTKTKKKTSRRLSTRGSSTPTVAVDQA